ncbi:hypothetical protein [Sphingobium sp. SCG-1]|uniref:hypothetical protein n=1 Tax=Sphingobium sp. SCG-1 TaxID=2072936 RepID=UPI0011AB4C16|nr:hypothetical protein [Sphingobium sp. SCG-1]
MRPARNVGKTRFKGWIPGCIIATPPPKTFPRHTTASPPDGEPVKKYLIAGTNQKAICFTAGKFFVGQYFAGFFVDAATE